MLRTALCLKERFRERGYFREGVQDAPTAGYYIIKAVLFFTFNSEPPKPAESSNEARMQTRQRKDTATRWENGPISGTFLYEGSFPTPGLRVLRTGLQGALSQGYPKVKEEQFKGNIEK